MSLSIQVLVHDSLDPGDSLDLRWCNDCFKEEPTPEQVEQLANAFENVARLLRGDKQPH